jgi:hypothetical protein
LVEVSDCGAPVPGYWIQAGDAAHRNVPAFHPADSSAFSHLIGGLPGSISWAKKFLAARKILMYRVMESCYGACDY